MNNDEVNRYIHEKIMGLCWHEFPRIPDDDTAPRCLHCDKHTYYLDKDYLIGGDKVCGKFNPDYTSDSSPRSLLNEVISKMNREHTVAMAEAMFDIPLSDNHECMTAEQIARACVEAHQSAFEAATDSEASNAIAAAWNTRDSAALDIAKQRLDEAEKVLQSTSEASRKQLDIIQAEGFVFNGEGGRWEKLAFTLYSALVEVSTDARHWIEDTAPVDDGREIQET